MTNDIPQSAVKGFFNCRVTEHIPVCDEAVSHIVALSNVLKDMSTTTARAEARFLSQKLLTCATKLAKSQQWAEVAKEDLKKFRDTIAKEK